MPLISPHHSQTLSTRSWHLLEPLWPTWTSVLKKPPHFPATRRNLAGEPGVGQQQAALQHSLPETTLVSRSQLFLLWASFLPFAVCWVEQHLAANPWLPDPTGLEKQASQFRPGWQPAASFCCRYSTTETLILLGKGPSNPSLRQDP